MNLEGAERKRKVRERNKIGKPEFAAGQTVAYNSGRLADKSNGKRDELPFVSAL
ncbi:hypothetical protein J42TS3_22270 [Paenibacillus vini]|uniref:Uncharacterized protein n=1 Tax=Paenibacillus vini TaxID=1476024 RepID=A0ABQ4MB32_9BACL|nr:hypothetical protein J42TS3_22270 [Paenibacillus vini]